MISLRYAREAEEEQEWRGDDVFKTEQTCLGPEKNTSTPPHATVLNTSSACVFISYRCLLFSRPPSSISTILCNGHGRMQRTRSVFI